MISVEVEENIDLEIFVSIKYFFYFYNVYF